MNIKQDLQQANNRLEKARRKLNAAHERKDAIVIKQFDEEVSALMKQIASLKQQQTRTLKKQGSDVKTLPFKRELTKAEQADMGQLKKSVRGLVVVHPMTALGREMGISKVTGFAPKAF